MDKLPKQKGRRTKPKFVPVYPVKEYRSGLKAGDRVRLKKPIIIKDHTGNATGKVYPVGQVWTVLPGARGNPTVIWLRQADGSVHTWDDRKSIFKTFEIVESLSSNGNNLRTKTEREKKSGTG